MSSFFFTSSPPSASLQRDIASLASWPLGALEAFGPVLAAFLGQHRHQEELLGQFVASQPGGENAVAASARTALGSLLQFFSLSLKAGAGGRVGEQALATHVRSDLRLLGLDDARASLLSAHCLSALSNVAEHALAKTLSTGSLQDISWKFGVSAAGSEMDKMGSCFLQLRLTIDRGQGNENVLMELSLPQFYKFLQQMQLANRQMQNLSK